ncbi:hypothetical protein EV652_112179 [Kribbella steppae]|uniref:DUF7144 domain-containing protein n=1 Tax=Kribbella steppae TaxID=2512223 RepID=A0A4R2H489_9ACTN|nr:hypothetical protein [Kribbella steppae]TCO20433.1 hypothetical protein EV652_112179 [Kribbella steppae]
MSDSDRSATTPRHQAPQPQTESGVRLPGVERRGWVGPIMFAAVVMIVLGFFHAFQGLIALLNEEYYLVDKNGLALHLDYTAWGWTQLIVGAIVCAAGFCLLLGQLWARIVAIILAVLSILVNAAFLAAYPVWSTIMIAFGILVIWALTFHGREVRTHDDAGAFPY